MRNAFAQEMVAVARDYPKLVMLSGDIGNRLFDPFKKHFGDRFFNCGVAEANMTGLAAGLAMCGMKPITYTITPFNTLRCLEQIKIDICYHNLPVAVVGVGAGLSYAGLGATHQACEDIAVLRMLPNMTVLCPGDAMEVRGAVRAIARHPGPVYMRLGKKNEPLVHDCVPDLVIGKGIVVRQGDTVCLLSTGNMLPVAVNAAEALRKTGISCQVVSMHTVKPLDDTLLADAFGRYAVIATLEEHMRAGGFGAAILEWKNDHQADHVPVLRFGMADCFLRGAGNQNNARRLAGLTIENVVAGVQKTLT